jgi:putative endonuclease
MRQKTVTASIVPTPVAEILLDDSCIVAGGKKRKSLYCRCASLTNIFSPLLLAQSSYTRFVHYFYLARCADGSLYAGTCVNVRDREARHNEGKGAKYTRSRRPVQIIYVEDFTTMSEARKREAAVKRMTRAEKEKLLKSRHRTKR